MCSVCHAPIYTVGILNGKRAQSLCLRHGYTCDADACGGDICGQKSIEEGGRHTRSTGMQRVLVIGASGGIGSALARAFENDGAEVSTLSRSENGFDITDEAVVDAQLGALEGPFDIALVATGALEINGAEPEKSIRAVSCEAMLDQFALNAVGPALVLRHAARLLPRDGQGIFAVLTARVGSIGDNRLGGWTSYRAAKAAANQIVRTTSIELTRTHPKSICVALHPGTVATAFTAKYLGRHPSVSPSEAAENLKSVIGGLTPDSTGRFFDWAGKEVPW